MNIAVFIAIEIVLGCCTFIFLALIRNIRFSKIQIISFFIFFTFSLSILAYFTKPDIGEDLYRHYEEIERMRVGGIEYLYTDAIYKSNPIINIFYYLISLTNISRLLPWATILIIYFILFKATYKFYFKYRISSQVLMIFILIHFAICFFRFSVSGIRNVLAFSFVCEAIYREYIEEKKDYKNIVLYLIAIGIHTSSIVLIIARILFQFKKIYKFRYIILFWTFFSKSIINIATIIPYDFIQEASEKFIFYKGVEGLDSRVLIVYMLFCIIIYCMNERILLLKKRIKDYDLINYFKYYNIIIFITYGSISIPTLFTRMCNLVSMLALPTVAMFFKVENKRYLNIVIYFMLIIIVALFAYQAREAQVYWRFYEKI